MPTGEIKSVEGTALDFRNGKPVREGLGAYDKDEKTVTEYDHNFVLNGDDVCDVAKAAQFVCKETGRMMKYIRISRDYSFIRQVDLRRKIQKTV